MTPDEFADRMSALIARRSVRPATPEYLAEMGAKIDALEAEFVGPRLSGPGRPGLLGLAQYLDDIRYGIGHGKKRPEPHDRRQD